MKRRVIVLMVPIIVILSSCQKKDIQKDSKIAEEKEVVFNNTTETAYEEKNEIHNEQKISITRELKNPLKLYREINFVPMEKEDLSLVSLSNDDNNAISFIYNDEEIVKISDLDIKIDSILNQCIPYSDNRLYSSSFMIDSGKKVYYGIISFKYGYIKIYEWLLNEDLKGWPYYSGNSNYFVLNDIWIAKETYYDYLKYKTVPAEYDGILLMYDIETDNIVYSIPRKELHETILLSIDKIQYDDDGFTIRIGNYLDSDEFVDFKLFTDNNNFRYEIYDKYSYSDDE